MALGRTVGLILAGMIVGLAGLATDTARAADDGLVVKTSGKPVAETLDDLTAVLEARGLTIFARIDHAAGAERVDLELRPTELLIFGNPKVGTPLMADAASAAIDLPLKALAWRGEDDVVRLAYTDPAWLAQRHGVAADHPSIVTMTNALGALTDAALTR